MNQRKIQMFIKKSKALKQNKTFYKLQLCKTYKKVNLKLHLNNKQSINHYVRLQWSMGDYLHNAVNNKPENLTKEFPLT